MAVKRDDEWNQEWQGQWHEMAGLDIFQPTEQAPIPPAVPSGEYERYGDFGQYGVTSAELPAMTPEQVAAQQREQRQAWERAQSLRARIGHKLDALRRQRKLSNAAYDLLQSEFSEGRIPDVYEDAATGQWLVWSDYEQRRYTLASWERHAQAALPVADPERETARLTQPSIAPAATTQRPWHASLDSQWPNTPARPMRPTPQFWQGWRRSGAPALRPAGYGVAAPATRPMLTDDNEKRGLC